MKGAENVCRVNAGEFAAQLVHLLVTANILIKTWHFLSLPLFLFPCRRREHPEREVRNRGGKEYYNSLSRCERAISCKYVNMENKYCYRALHQRSSLLAQSPGEYMV